MDAVLVIKTGALGDVLRTTSILPGLQRRFAGLQVTWLTAESARSLVERHPLVTTVVTCNPKDESSVAAAQGHLDRPWDWILSLDDEVPLCALAAALPTAKLSGATLDAAGDRTYTEDVEPWFGMGLLAKAGKAVADARKIANRDTHPAIFAQMLELEAGRPELPLPDSATRAAQSFAAEHGLGGERLAIGLNTGAGGRWTSKGLPVDRVIDYARALTAAVPRPLDFLVLGGPDERGRNDEILAGIGALDGPRALDAGTDNPIPDFAALVGLSDLLLTSDSLALHLGISRDVKMVAFFAPTSAAEIELYGLGEKVLSTADDYCTYRPDASNDTITVDRLVAASLRVLNAAETEPLPQP